MARIKVIGKNLNQDLIGGGFTNDASQTIFSLGNFFVESNFTGRKTRSYSGELSSFIKPITLESIGLTDATSRTIDSFTSNTKLNLDRSDLKSFVKYGSSRELLRVAIEGIISDYPSSLFVSSQVELGGNITVRDYAYNAFNDSATFRIPSNIIVNTFEMVFNDGNTSVFNNNTLKNLNLSFQKFVIWRKDLPTTNSHYILGYTGDTATDSNIYLSVKGNPFSGITGTTTTGRTNYHLKPEPLEFNKFLETLNDLEKYFLANRNDDLSAFEFEFKEPQLLENGEILYSVKNQSWGTTDGYNIDISGSRYDSFFTTLLIIGEKYDLIKTDLIARFLTPSSLKLYDLTDEGKLEKLLRIYGREFDELKQFIDSLVNINKVSYDKKNNIPDTLIKNLAKTLGWDVFNLVSEKDLIESFFSSETERQKNDLLPSEIDIELWRRILINTNYYWRSKGTRKVIKSIFLLIGIPEPFINITEYVYTVNGKINPNNVTISLEDLSSASLPYNIAGYPIAPVETNDFYFQASGNTDSGQRYMNNFRNVGFRLNRKTDNKKSWEYAARIERIHSSTPNYIQEASELIVNTKEADVTLDLARGIEFDVYTYNKDVDDPLTSTGFTDPYIYVNVPFDYSSNTGVFTIPDVPLTGSSIQVSFNGVTLTSGSTGVGDYIRTGIQEITLNSETAKIHSTSEKDLITLTYLFDKLGGTGYTQVKYLVQVPVISVDGTLLTLPEEPKGDIQLIIDGVTMTKGNSLFVGDFIINEQNRTEIIVQNNSLQQYLQENPVVTIWYLAESVQTNATKKSEVHRVDNLSSVKLFYNSGIDKYVYTMNVKAFDINSIKITINGITIQNGVDFTLNPSNKKQIFLNGVIKFGDVIGVYYVIDDGSFVPPLLPPDSAFPDIQDMSFLEYLELIQRRLISTRTRKTISDFNGGYYPTVMSIYDEYLKRSLLSNANPLQSNGYTFLNLYPFINQYNAFFNRFVKELLPVTLILRKGGILIRNTSFNRQKFMYRRGVNFDPNLQWLGTDSAEYLKSLPVLSCAWSSDFICAVPPSPCANFTLDNLIIVEDPQPASTTTSTSTTVAPIFGNTLIAVGGLTDSEIFKSVDNGANWTKLTTNGGYTLRAVDFLNSNFGLAVGDGGTVWKTTNGGDNWALIGDPQGNPILPSAIGGLKSIDFPADGSDNAYIGGNGFKIYLGINEGTFWVETPSGNLDQLSKGMYAFDASNAVSVSWAGTNRILKTIDGGAIWSDVDNGNVPILQAIDFFDGNNVGLAVGMEFIIDGIASNPSPLYKSNDSGNTWSDKSGTVTNPTLPTPNEKLPKLNDIKFTTATNAYACGSRGSATTTGSEPVLFKTTNAGNTWGDLSAAITPEQTVGVNSMTWKNDSEGWLAMSDGSIFMTQSGGNSWIRTQISDLVGTLHDIVLIQ